jgi:hypothetical protein
MEGDILDSFALAYVPTEKVAEESRFSVKVNINLWTQCGWNEENPILDIGLMISNLSDASKVRLYIPFCLKYEELEDLCECLSKDANLLGAVFNEPYTSIDDLASNSKKAEVIKGRNSKETEFILYKLDFSSEKDVVITSYKNNKGTFLEFDPHFIKGNATKDACDQYYLRFRVRTPSLKECVREYQAPNRYFETLVNSTYMVDIRFNNTRSMDRSLVQELTAQDNWSLAPINGLHFLLMTKVDVDVDTNSRFNSSRALEKDIWNDYVNLDNTTKRSTEDIIAYHSSQKVKAMETDIGSWEFFTRLKAGKCNAKTIGPYLFLLIFLNIESNFAFNLCLTLLPFKEKAGVFIAIQVLVLLAIAFVCWRILIWPKRKEKP